MISSAKNTKIPLFALALTLLLGACGKETVTINGNNPPDYSKVPTIKIQNYVNRIFIDLIGREPLDIEMDLEVEALKLAELSLDSRRKLISKLQTDTSYVFGDGSYKKAYYQYLYNLSKIRCIEGSSDGEINQALGPILFGMTIDSINMDWEAFNKKKIEADKYRSILNSKTEIENGIISYDQIFTRLINNGIYDNINMNSFNYVNATFDNLLWRYPSKSEFMAGYNVIEFNKPQVIFGAACSDKQSYCDAITNTPEFFEGMIIWIYKLLLSRDPSSAEVSFLLAGYISQRDIRIIQSQILETNEYANF